MSGYLEGLLVILAINVIAAYGAFIPLAAGQLNLGIAGFMAIGAYVAAYLSNEMALPLALTVAGGTTAAGIVGITLGYPLLRTKGIYLVLATLAFGELVRSGLLNLEFVGAAAGYPVGRHAGVEIVCAVAVVATMFVVWLYHTRLGLAMMSIREDEIAADQFGVDVRSVRAIAFALGAAMAGLAGSLYAHHYTYIEAQKFNVVLSVYVAMYVLLGGVQTVIGPLLGALFFTMMPELFRIGNAWRFVIFAVVVILTMIWRPEGLVDRALVDRFKRWFSVAAGNFGIAREGPR